ncbi:MAG: hypothetical protein H6626_09590 [Pseudobdellovibrionaceae bacterium]|nr:hypothetical protein [Bdellovibrionales bacterium]USN46467.1 MAG: hypothetical protein H6626_09590 [Pseudobdellovibrionaceae bacterium]
MDSFDDFEMKPITEGLGFHKKAVKLNDHVKKADLFREGPGRSIPQAPSEDALADEARRATSALDELLASLEPPKSLRAQESAARKKSQNDVKIYEPLPRKDINKAVSFEPEIEPSRSPSPEIKDMGVGAELVRQTPPAIIKPAKASTGTQRGASDQPPYRLRPQPASLSSAALDALVVLAFSMVFLLSLLLVTKVDLLAVFDTAKTDLPTQLSMAILYLAVLEIYVVISRSFFGKTLAEWTFDLQMGDDRQVKKAYYPLLVVWRSLVVLATGVVLLPLLSFIVRRDLTSYLSGLQLYKKRR